MILKNKVSYSKWIIKCSIFILITGLLYLGANLCIVYGVMKERANKNCVGAEVLLTYERTLELANSICVDVQVNQLEEIKENYKNKVDTAEAEALKWKNYYLHQKKQYEDNQENIN